MKKIASILLAFILSAGMFGFTTNKHYCGNILRGISVLTGGSCVCSYSDEQCEMPDHHGNTDACGMAMDHNNSGSDDDGNCCDDQVQNINLNLQYTFTTNDFQTESLVSDLDFFSGIFVQFRGSESLRLTHLAYHPPPPQEQDVPVLFQSFLL